MADFTIRFDGSAVPNPGRGGAGGQILFKEGPLLCEVEVRLGTCTNNVAEYCALIECLKALYVRAARPSSLTVDVSGDSEVVIKQMNGTYQVKNPRLKLYHAIAQGLVDKFAVVSFDSIPRYFNVAADALASSAQDAKLDRDDMLVYYPSLMSLSRVSINGRQTVGSNDVMAAGADEEFLIDADFLVSLPGYGLSSLRERLLPFPLSVISGKDFESNVLGLMGMNVRFTYSVVEGHADDEVKEFEKKLHVVVVDSLPGKRLIGNQGLCVDAFTDSCWISSHMYCTVPFHVTSKHPRVSDCSISVTFGSGFAKLKKRHFPNSYQSHSYWEDTGTIIIDAPVF